MTHPNRRDSMKTIAAGMGAAMFHSISLYAEEQANLTPFAETPLRAGMIGLDTSHVVAFTGLLNDPAKATGVLSTVKVTAAFPGGSPDIPSSRDRVEGYTATLRDKHGVKICDSIEAMLEEVDVVFLESVDGRPHLDQIRPVIAARKPVFVDKPVAGTLADAVLIYQLAEKAAVPIFSSSSLRYSQSTMGAANKAVVGDVLGAVAFSPCALEEHHPDLFWYGIHGVESLFTIMGTGCKSVSRTHSPDFDVVVGSWEGGRVGTFRGIRKGKADYGATVFGSKSIYHATGYSGYQPLVEKICQFFQDGKPPVSAKETIEMFAFMEAADESKRRGGSVVTLSEVLEKASETNSKRS
ncbi:MAG: hypothetical protein RJA81_2108 [Planctomycetota bacterium]|jgi:predicted dehydrogenase